MPEAGWRRLGRGSARARRDGECNGGQRAAVALVRRDRCAGRLAVRNRRPGDRFRPVGLGGQKKLQDFFVDRKVARDAARPRCRWSSTRPIGLCGWPGYGIDEAFRVTDPAQAVIILRLKAGWEALLELDVEESVVLDGARRRSACSSGISRPSSSTREQTVTFSEFMSVGRRRAAWRASSSPARKSPAPRRPTSTSRPTRRRSTTASSTS